MGLEVVAEMIAAIGKAARLSSADLKQAAAEAKTYRTEIEAARETTSGMAMAGGASPNTNQLAAALKAVR